MRKNPHDRILKGKPKKQYINIVHKSFSFKKSLEPIFISLIYYFNFSLNQKKKKLSNFFVHRMSLQLVLLITQPKIWVSFLQNTMLL